MPLHLLVLSDLHAFTPKNRHASTDDVSFLRATDAILPGYPDPIDQVGVTIERERLEVDWVICPGDLADKADADAQAYVWRKLEGLRVKLGAKRLISTAGNHDIDSRLKGHNFDAKGALQSLQPPFPGLDEATCDRYWARNFHVLREENALLLNVNSSAFHGFSSEEKDAKPEYIHGRVSQRTIDAINSQLSPPNSHLNILLTHHHPERDESVYPDDVSEMMLGSKLVQDIQELTRKNWLVIHGHQHFPRVTYGRGASYRSVIFSAGSLSATLVGEQSRRAVNQFYHLTVETEEVSPETHGPCGIIRAWHWAGLSNWEPSPASHRIPDHCGFGYTAAVPALAKRINEIVREHGTPLMTYLDICEHQKELRFILKETFDQVVHELIGLGIAVIKAEKYVDSHFKIQKAEAL